MNGKGKPQNRRLAPWAVAKERKDEAGNATTSSTTTTPAPSSSEALRTGIDSLSLQNGGSGADAAAAVFQGQSADDGAPAPQYSPHPAKPGEEALRHGVLPMSERTSRSPAAFQRPWARTSGDTRHSRFHASQGGGSHWIGRLRVEPLPNVPLSEWHTNFSVFIANLPQIPPQDYAASEKLHQELEELLRQDAAVERVRLARSNRVNTFSSAVIAFAEVKDLRSAGRLIQEANGKELRGLSLRLELATAGETRIVVESTGAVDLRQLKKVLPIGVTHDDLGPDDHPVSLTGNLVSAFCSCFGPVYLLNAYTFDEGKRHAALIQFKVTADAGKALSAFASLPDDCPVLANFLSNQPRLSPSPTFSKPQEAVRSSQSSHGSPPVSPTGPSTAFSAVVTKGSWADDEADDDVPLPNLEHQATQTQDGEEAVAQVQPAKAEVSEGESAPEIAPGVGATEPASVGTTTDTLDQSREEVKVTQRTAPSSDDDREGAGRERHHSTAPSASTAPSPQSVTIEVSPDQPSQPNTPATAPRSLPATPKLEKTPPSTAEFPVSATMCAPEVKNNTQNRPMPTQPRRPTFASSDFVEDSEVDPHAVFVANLPLEPPPETLEFELLAIFARFGHIERLRVLPKKHTIGWLSFVTYMDESGATAALAADGTTFYGRPLRVAAKRWGPDGPPIKPKKKFGSNLPRRGGNFPFATEAKLPPAPAPAGTATPADMGAASMPSTPTEPALGFVDAGYPGFRPGPWMMAPEYSYMMPMPLVIPPGDPRFDVKMPDAWGQYPTGEQIPLFSEQHYEMRARAASISTQHPPATGRGGPYTPPHHIKPPTDGQHSPASSPHSTDVGHTNEPKPMGEPIHLSDAYTRLAPHPAHGPPAPSGVPGHPTMAGPPVSFTYGPSLPFQQAAGSAPIMLYPQPPSHGPPGRVEVSDGGWQPAAPFVGGPHAHMHPVSPGSVPPNVQPWGPSYVHPSSSAQGQHVVQQQQQSHHPQYPTPQAPQRPRGRTNSQLRSPSAPAKQHGPQPMSNGASRTNSGDNASAEPSNPNPNYQGHTVARFRLPAVPNVVMPPPTAAMHAQGPRPMGRPQRPRGDSFKQSNYPQPQGLQSAPGAPRSQAAGATSSALGLPYGSWHSSASSEPPMPTNPLEQPGQAPTGIEPSAEILPVPTSPTSIQYDQGQPIEIPSWASSEQ